MTVRHILVGSLVFAIAACGPSSEAGDSGWDVIDNGGKADGLGSSSYGALAQLSIPAPLDNVRAGLIVLDDDVLPHEAKDIRKRLAALRDQVDLFSFAYKPGKHEDTWKDIRDELDDGYETIGAFKDLFDRQGVEDPADAVYDDDEVAELRDEVLQWNAGFADPQHQDDIGGFLAAPSMTKLFDRDGDDQSRFFWREADLVPSTKLSGLANMARLERELIDKARDDLADTEEIRDLTDEKHAVAFHDFRKRIRSIARLPGYFAAIVKAGDTDSSTELLAVVTEAVDRYGTLNDKIGAHAKAVEKDDDDKADDLQDEIKADWKTLRDWQDDVDLDEVLDDLKKTLHKP